MARLIKRHIESFFEFEFKNLSSFGSFVKWMYEPRNPSCLGAVRILFGCLMMVDVLHERRGWNLMSRWGDPRDCHFPLFPHVQRPDLFYMALIYCIMWLGALGITIGYKFRLSTLAFIIPYWFVLLLDKTYWNNHSYLFGVVSILLLGSSANASYSIDSYMQKTKDRTTVPFWNYFVLKFQFFMLYFMAGIKKIDMEWLGGYSMRNLSVHWVFEPFTMLLTREEIDYLIVHWFGFFLDLTVGFWLLNSKTKPYAIVFCGAFHFMNSRLFNIGMFPYVCLATMPIFCDEDWPLHFKKLICPKPSVSTPQKDNSAIETPTKTTNEIITWKHRFVVVLLLSHCGLQFFLPFSHGITKGYNNWTKGLYGYSWDMMVHSWNTALVVVKVVDNQSGKEYFVNPEAFTQNDRWNKHADMCVQYAQCLKGNLESLRGSTIADDSIVTSGERSEITLPDLSNNLSIYIDVWCSLNRRLQQRMFDPNYDLLKANWSPLKSVEWLLPILSENDEFRDTLNEVEKYVYSWSNHSDVLFVADFPGMYLENYLSTDLRNVTLTVLYGEVVYEIENAGLKQSFGVRLAKGSSYGIHTGMFHKINTIGKKPSLYMYTYVNQTLELLDNQKELLQ